MRRSRLAVAVVGISGSGSDGRGVAFLQHSTSGAVVGVASASSAVSARRGVVIYGQGSKPLELLGKHRGFTSPVWLPAPRGTTAAPDPAPVRAGFSAVVPLANAEPVDLVCPQRMFVFNVAQLEPIADTDHSWGAVRTMALKALTLDALATLGPRGHFKPRTLDSDGDRLLRERAAAVAMNTLAAAVPAAVRERMSLPSPPGGEDEVLRNDQMVHRSLASSGSFPRPVAEALDATVAAAAAAAAGCGKEAAPLKLWLTIRAVKEQGLRGRPGEVAHVAIASAPRPMFNVEQLENGGDIAAAPVRFGTFTHLPTDSPVYHELVALVARRGWNTGLFLTRDQLATIGASPRAGEQPYHCGGGGVVPSADGGSAAMTLVPACAVKGALQAAHDEVSRAMASSSASATVMLQPGLAGELEAALATSPKSAVNAKRAWPSDVPTAVHRRAFTGAALTGPALASAVALTAVLPEHQRDTWWVTVGELEAHGLAFDPLTTPRATVAENPRPMEAGGSGGQKCDAFAEAVLEAAMINEGRARVSVAPSQRLSTFIQQDLFHAEQLEQPEKAYAASRDLGLMRRFASNTPS